MPAKNENGGVRAKRRKRTALVITKDGKRFWTTQAQFWQWVRERKVTKLCDYPLTGGLVLDQEEQLVLISHTLLNRANQNHLNEFLGTRRLRRQ